MKIKHVSRSKVKRYDNNPRINSQSVDAVARSIERYGWKQPIVVDEDFVIVVGDTRYLAAEKLDLAMIPVVVADDLSPEQIREYRIADNKTGEISLWDHDRLHEEILALAESEEFEIPGFDQSELDRIINPPSPDGGESPDGFKEFTGEEETKHECPKCGYKWN